MQKRVFLASDAPSIGTDAGQEPTPSATPEPVRKSRKKSYVLIGVVAVAAVLIAVLSISMIPQGLGETIPYGVSYNVGEKLTYSISVKVSVNGQQVVETGTMSMHIASFDGENYTIDETVHYETQGVSNDYSFTLVINKAGQMVGGANFPSQLQSAYSIYSMMQGSPGYGLFLNRTEVRVGETFQIPININNGTMSVSGTENVKVGAVQNVTVAAGTYKTFTIELSTSNFQASSQGVEVSISLNGKVHMEYSTCHAIDFNLQGTATAEGTTMNLEMNMALTADTTE